MMNLYQIASIIDVIALSIAYIFSETLANFFRAWIAKKMGDDTAQQLGFLTLNPLAHLDILGMAFLVIGGFGWGKHVPVNPYNFSYPYRFLKQAFTYVSDFFAHMIIGLIACICLFYLFGPEVLTMPIAQLTHHYPGNSSLVIALGGILIKLVYANAMLGVLTIIANTIDLILFNFFHDMYQQSYIVFVCSIIALMTVAAPLMHLMVCFIFRFAWLIILFIGI